MSEESKSPRKSKPAHVFNFVAGLVTAAVCFGFVLVSHKIGLKLDGEIPGVGTVQNALILGGMLSAGVSVYGAKRMPGDGQ